GLRRKRRLLERPFQRVAEARLLVQAEAAAAGEMRDAVEGPVLGLEHRLLAPRVGSLGTHGGHPPDEVVGDPFRGVIGFARIKPIEYRHGGVPGPRARQKPSTGANPAMPPSRSSRTIHPSRLFWPVSGR